MIIYTNRNILTLDQQKKIIDRIVSALLFSTSKECEVTILREFNISPKTYKYVISVLIGNFDTMQKRTNIRLRDELAAFDRKLAFHCWESKVLPAMYEDNKDVFRGIMSEIKQLLIAKL